MKSTDIAGRFVIGSALVDAMRIAPALMIVGPDVDRANRLMAVLQILCRHALSLAGATPAGIRSLPSGVRFTFLITQTTVSPALQNLLDDASKRDQKIPSRGGLLDLFGAQVIHSGSFLSHDCSPARSMQISMIPGRQALPAFDQEMQRRIASEFQGKLLDFRRTSLAAACQLNFDGSKFNLALRDLARSFAAATPDDAELQAEVCDLLKGKDDELRSEKWTNLSGVAIEAVRVLGRESPNGLVYVSELATIAQEILLRRGSAAEINPAVMGKILKDLGFTTEPRDAKGKKLNLAIAVPHAEELARDFGVPDAGGGQGIRSTEENRHDEG